MQTLVKRALILHVYQHNPCRDFIKKTQNFDLNNWFYVTEGPRCVTNSQVFDVLCLEQLMLRNILAATRSSNKQVSISYDNSEMVI